METLTLPEYKRYGRQMILDGFGLDAQLKLKNAKVVVIGAGGLGCPALQYLAAVGVGRIGIVDHDTVEISNLQRQILHKEQSVGQYKAESASAALKQINSLIQVDLHITTLNNINAKSILSEYDILLDCTDNAPTRYLLSDTAVVLGKPLVSGAALKFDGQICTYNLQPNGPCYRCLFPKPPAPENLRTCEDAGVLGAVTGVIGTLQALEAIKLITGQHDGTPSLLIFSALTMPLFRSVKVRNRRPQCPACGEEGMRIGKIEENDYVAFCGGLVPDWETLGKAPGNTEERMTATQAKDMMQADTVSKEFHILDVRSHAEFNICHLEGSINVPLRELVHNPAPYLPKEGSSPILVVCKLGNDSQIAAKALREATDSGTKGALIIKDLIGGLRAWSRDIDRAFPIY